MAPDAPTPDPSPATIEGYGECRRCHQHRRLVAHGATCQPCLNRIEAARWVERTFTVSLDVGSYGEDVDDEEITYLLRMGGIDAEVIPMPDPSPDTPSVYAPRCGHHGNPLTWLGDDHRWRCPDCFPELFPPATPTAPGSSSPDTAALVAELRGGIAECGYRDADDPCPACVSDARCADALEAQDSRITELEAHNRRLATTMTGDTATDLRVLYAYELGLADHTLTTPTEETTE